MSYTVLNDYLATKDKATVEQGFRQYVSIYGTDNIGNEAWSTYSFALLGKSEPDTSETVHDKDAKTWAIYIKMLHGFMYLNRIEYGTTAVVTWWYSIEGSKTIDGQAEYLSDPIEIKAWFNKHFSNFVKQYIQHEQDV